MAEPGPPHREKDTSAIARRRRQAAAEGNPTWLARRAQILEAAAEVFRVKGFRATAVSDIANRLKSDRANMYYYFAGKAEIFLALVQDAVEHNVASVEAAAAAPDSPTERLLRVIRELAESYDRHYPCLHLFAQEDLRWVTEDSTDAERALREASERYDAALMRITEAGVRCGEFRPEIDPRMLRFAVLGAVNWAHRWFSPEGPLTGGDVGHAFADIFLRGFAARAVEA